MCMVDLTDLPGIRSGDEVEVFGQSNPIERMAEAAGTITYELLCAVSRRVPRVYLRDGQVVARHTDLSL
jgi:alanine racemase